MNASGGLDAGLVDIAANNKGKTNTTQGNSASKGGKAADSDPGLGAGFGVSIGGGFDVGFTNPNESGAPGGPLSAAYAPPANAKEIPKGDGDAPMSQELADVNGDGLPDVVYTNDERRVRALQPRLRLRRRGVAARNRRIQRSPVNWRPRIDRLRDAMG